MRLSLSFPRSTFNFRALPAEPESEEMEEKMRKRVSIENVIKSVSLKSFLLVSEGQCHLIIFQTNSRESVI